MTDDVEVRVRPGLAQQGECAHDGVPVLHVPVRADEEKPRPAPVTFDHSGQVVGSDADDMNPVTRNAVIRDD
jgi:hypothetical protein